ncbi:MAG TPA: DUF1707 domain-containing protein [Streptosporangiaceae bacterium]
MPGDRSLLGDADRDRLIAVLREHYAAGRMDTGELSRRVGIVLTADYADEAAAGLDGLPPLAAPGSAPARSSARSRARKRHAQVIEPEAGWVPTAERFRDPSSGTIMRVWTDPADSSRHYVPDDSPS